MKFSTVLLTLLLGTQTTLLSAQDNPLDQPKLTIGQLYAKSKAAKSATEFAELIQACQEMLAGDLDQVHADYVKSLASWAHNRRGAIRLELAKQFVQAGNDAQGNQALKEARDDLDAAISLDASRWRAFLNRGAVSVAEGNLEAAISDFSAVIRLRPQETSGWFDRAEVNYELKHYESALQDYVRALEESPGDLQALTGQAHALFQLGRFDEALREYDAVLKTLPKNAWARANRGDVHQALGNWKQAYQDYSAALELQAVGGICQRLAWLLATCPDAELLAPEQARDLARKAIELDGETATNLETLAAAHAANGDFDLAKQAQEQAISMSSRVSGEMEQRRAMFEKAQVYRQSIKR